jgi:hypothetical protein
LGFAETYNCAQVLLGSIKAPPASAVLSDADPDELKLLMERRANSTAVVLLRISLTKEISVGQLYICKTPERPSGSARKAWLNLHKMFHPVRKERMHELKNEFIMCIIHRDDTNPAVGVHNSTKYVRN